MPARPSASSEAAPQLRWSSWPPITWFTSSITWNRFSPNDSENQFQGELQDARFRRAADDAEAGAVERGVRRAQVGMIEHVEELAAELQPLLLRQLEVLEQRIVQIPSSRRPQLSP